MFRELRDHYESIMWDHMFYLHCENLEEWIWSVRIKSLLTLLGRLYIIATCRMFDHNLQTDCRGLEDSGGEDLYCVRCGWSVRVWHN